MLLISLMLLVAGATLMYLGYLDKKPENIKKNQEYLQKILKEDKYHV